jgi:hypothetical protein
MLRYARTIAAAALVAAVAVAPAVDAQMPGGEDQAAIEALISDQIAAFQRDDGTTAYSMAAPAIQDLFPSVDEFMAMVRQGYAPVYRPRSVVFGALSAGDGGPVQQVYLTGPDGLAYTAVYALERQPDGSWRIAGCVLVRDTRPSI